MLERGQVMIRPFHWSYPTQAMPLKPWYSPVGRSDWFLSSLHCQSDVNELGCSSESGPLCAWNVKRRKEPYDAKIFLKPAGAQWDVRESQSQSMGRHIQTRIANDSAQLHWMIFSWLHMEPLLSVRSHCPVFQNPSTPATNLFGGQCSLRMRSLKQLIRFELHLQS